MTYNALDALAADVSAPIGEDLFANSQFQLGRRTFREGLPLSTLHGQLVRWGWLDAEYVQRERGPRCP